MFVAIQLIIMYT